MFVAVQLLEDTPAVLSLGKFSDEIQYFQRVERRRDTIFQNGKTAPCKCDNSVPIVVSTLHAQQKSQLESIKELTPDEQETTLAWRNRLQDLPEWLEEFTKKFGGTKINIFWQ